MPIMRTLRFGSAGEDVLRVKERLFTLGCYEAHITQLKSEQFGCDTRNAVKTFQRRNGLPADGIVGALTYAALFPQESAEASLRTDGEIFPHISRGAKQAILSSMEGASETRKGIVMDALQFAFDPAVPREFPVSLYIRGGNLYNTDLLPNVITLARIQSGAARQPEFYDGGRQEMMERAVLQNPAITGADCSGGVVGLLRHAGAIQPKFDLSADGFAANRSIRNISREELIPADLLHKSGHIGLYAGAGYAVEWMGGAYGCQLTRIAQRRGWNFVKHREERFGAWTSFLRPAWYE